MRTTLTLDDDLVDELKAAAHRRRVPFRHLVNQVLRLGLLKLREPRSRKAYVCPTFSMGMPASGTAALDKALALASLLEDEDLARRLENRK